MAGDAFEHIIKAYLEDLQHKLAMEHRLVLQDLEARWLAAEEDGHLHMHSSRRSLEQLSEMPGRRHSGRRSHEQVSEPPGGRQSSRRSLEQLSEMPGSKHSGRRSHEQVSEPPGGKDGHVRRSALEQVGEASGPLFLHARAGAAKHLSVSSAPGTRPAKMSLSEQAGEPARAEAAPADGHRRWQSENSSAGLPHAADSASESSSAAGLQQLADGLPGVMEGNSPEEVAPAEQQRRPSVHWDRLPSMASPAQTDEAASQGSHHSGLHFRVLDIWAPQTGGNKRKVSVHSFDAMSNGSRSRLGSEISSSIFSDDDDEDSQQRFCTRHCVQLHLQRFMLSPGSLRYLLWEIVGILLIAYDLVVIPLQILEPPESSVTMALSWLIRIYWTVDIPVSFLTGYVTAQGVVEMKPFRVAQQYARTRLALDLLLVSCDWVGVIVRAAGGGRISQGVLRLLGSLRAVRLIRLIQIIRTQKLSQLVFQRFRSEGVMLVGYIIGIVVMLLGLIHVIACLWHGIRAGTEGEAEARSEPGESPTERLWRQYSEDFHYVLALFVGEHLQEPRSVLERVFTISVLVFAFVVSAAFVGSLTTAMTRLQIIASKRSTQFAALSRYLSDYGISRDLAARVQRNARHALREQKRHTPESSVELMHLISDPLRSEIHYEVFSPVLNAHPFFRLYNTVNPAGVRHICHTAVSSQSLSRGDVIFSLFELPVSPRMFFLISGRMIYVRGMENEQQLTTKQWVAEAVLWTRWLHRGTLRALTESRVLVLDAMRLGNIMSTFPSRHGASYAAHFVEQLNQIECAHDLTDIPDNAEREARHIATCVFQELDRHFEVPAEWRARRSSIFSTTSSRRPSSFSATERSSGGSFDGAPSEVDVVPTTSH